MYKLNQIPSTKIKMKMNLTLQAKTMKIKNEKTDKSCFYQQRRENTIKKKGLTFFFKIKN